MAIADERPESIWTQLKQDATANRNPVRQLSRLVDGAAITAANAQGPKFDANFIDAGFFHVSAVDFDGRELVTVEEFTEAVGLALEFSHGEFTDISRDHFQGGLSYIELGAWIGDQGRAIKLMGLGKALGLWDLATPALLGIQGEMAKDLLGRGMFFIIPQSDSLLTAWFEAREEKGGVL